MCRGLIDELATQEVSCPGRASVSEREPGPRGPAPCLVINQAISRFANLALGPGSRSASLHSPGTRGMIVSSSPFPGSPTDDPLLLRLHSRESAQWHALYWSYQRSRPPDERA